jgi:predicted O-methyltransferase YrrM
MIDANIIAYSENHTTPDNAILNELQRETFLKVLLPNMISSPLQGAFLKMIAHINQSKRILEIGTFTGYATICLADGLTESGVIDTIDKNEELKFFHDKYFPKFPFHAKINCFYGDAMSIIPNLKNKYDLVFIDADKRNYCNYFDLIIDFVEPNGIIIADNVLQPNADKDAIEMDLFNKKVNNDQRVENVLLPLRDGLMIMKKKKYI